MRIMCLDYGDKNIGVAISDELKLIAYGLDVIKRKSPDKFYFEIQKLNDIIIKYEINKIIIGLPKNLDNTFGYQCEKTLVFKKKLEKAFNNLDIILWDERLSTSAASKNLSFIGLNARKQKKIIDKMAAVFILQGYLDYLKFKEDNNMIFDDDNFDDDNNDKDNVIMMFDEDGNEQEFYVLGSVDYKNEKYLIVSEDLELDEENEEQDVIVLKEVPHEPNSDSKSKKNNNNNNRSEDEKIDYHVVEDDDLLDTIISLFEDQLGDEE